MKKHRIQNTLILMSPTNNIQLILFFLVLFYSALLPLPLLAADDPLCPSKPVSASTSHTFSSDGKTHLQSDNVSFSEKDISRFDGHVVIQQKDKRIETDQAEYKKATEHVQAKGNVKLITDSIKINSESANFDLKSNHAVLQKAEYQMLNSHARGKADKIEIKNKNKNGSITKLSNATYTTCQPGNTDWSLNANNITLNNKTHQGHASHVVIRFKDVPFFYFPYLSFPLGEDRLSGFLFPSFSNSNLHGTELVIPYYWNIHPQLDATITPRFMTKRGTLLQSEFRYLTENTKGTLSAEQLYNDKIFKDDRERLQWKHQSTPKAGWQTKVDYDSVADIQHLNDFGNNLNSTSTTYLTRAADLIYNSQNWLLNVKAEDNQILSGTNPYKRLPQITLNSRYAEEDNVINYQLQTEAVRFDHADYKVIGQRVHIKPEVSYPLRTAAGFLESKLSLQYTNYNLQQTPGAKNLSRTVPTFSLNSGLFFERESQLFSNTYIQTLEPQLFYVYVPYKDQSALPIFDTSVYAFNINQSFTDYRFNGIDRIGDDNRLTTALATRFINQQSGKEEFMARIGQIYYFTDRKVQLPNVATDTTSRSNIIAEFKLQPNNWTISSQLEWDPVLKENVTSSSQLGYQYKKFNLNIAQRYQRNAIETREIKINWEINPRWKLHSSNLFDVRNDQIVENLFGVNYESCCWGLNLTTKERYLSSAQIDRGIYLELVLKGFGGFGIKQ